MRGKALELWAQSCDGKYRVGRILRGEKSRMEGFRAERIPRGGNPVWGGAPSGRNAASKNHTRDRGKNTTLEIPRGNDSHIGRIPRENNPTRKKKQEVYNKLCL